MKIHLRVRKPRLRVWKLIRIVVVHRRRRGPRVDVPRGVPERQRLPARRDTRRRERVSVRPTRVPVHQRVQRHVKRLKRVGFLRADVHPLHLTAASAHLHRARPLRVESDERRAGRELRDPQRTHPRADVDDLEERIRHRVAHSVLGQAARHDEVVIGAHRYVAHARGVRRGTQVHHRAQVLHPRVPEAQLTREASADDRAPRRVSLHHGRALATTRAFHVRVGRYDARADVDRRDPVGHPADEGGCRSRVRVRRRCSAGVVHGAARQGVVCGIFQSQVVAPSLHRAGRVARHARGRHGDDAAAARGDERRDVQHGRVAHRGRVVSYGYGRVRPARGVPLQRWGVKDGEAPVRRSRVEELLLVVERERGDRVGVATGAFGGFGDGVVGDVREAVAGGLRHLLRHLVVQVLMPPTQVRASGRVPRRRRRVRVDGAVGSHAAAVRLRGVRVGPVAVRGLPVALHDAPSFDLTREGFSP